MELIFIRHGESTANRQGVIQGQGDFPLSGTGKEQARLSADALCELRPACIYSSPLSRALETAHIINEPHGAELVTLPELMEYDLGEFEGLTMEEIRERCPAVQERIERGVPFHHLPANAETDEKVEKRAEEALRTILESGHDPVLVVSHLGVLALMISSLLERLDLPNPSGGNLLLKNCSISRVRTRPVPELIAFNNDTHLSSFAREARFR
ncbi:MAG: histidine phosphatase family protein [bacterium]